MPPSAPDPSRDRSRLGVILRRAAKHAPLVRRSRQGAAAPVGGDIQTPPSAPSSLANIVPSVSRGLAVTALAGGPGQRAVLLIRHQGQVQVDELLVTVTAGPDPAGTSLALRMPTHTLRPGEVCLVPIPERRPGPVARTSWVTGATRGQTLTPLAGGALTRRAGCAPAPSARRVGS